MQPQRTYHGNFRIFDRFGLQMFPHSILRQPQKPAGACRARKNQGGLSSAALHISEANAQCLAGGDSVGAVKGLKKEDAPRFPRR